MKKLLPVVALFCLMTACKDKKKEEPKPADTTTTTTTSTTGETKMDASSDVPKFADAEVQKYVDDYTMFVTSYVEAYKSKDASKIQDLSAKMSDWSSRSMSIGQKLAGNADEATKFTNYMTKLSKQMTDAMTMK